MKKSFAPASSLFLALAGAAGFFLLQVLPLADVSAADTPAPTTASVRVAEGFDFPVGAPNAVGYHKARGFRPNGHLGEDWDGDGGGNTDLGDPIYVVGNGIVVWARDMRLGWGNVVIVRHVYHEPSAGGALQAIDSLYGHLDRILVNEGQAVRRGQQIATMGTAHGLYEAHLHFEIRKNLTIGMNRSAFARDFSNYFDPTSFVNAHRALPGQGEGARIAINTFVPYPGAALPPSDGAYELGAVGAPTLPRLDTSASAIRRRTTSTGHPNFDQMNSSFHVDRFSDLGR